MKRQRGRGRKPGGGGGGSHGNHGNRSLESNGPEVKIRGTAAQIYEKYAQYARDSQQGGDRVKYENYLQHAEHYFRIMAATMPRERLFQQQGEGGAPFQPQAQGEGGQPQPAGTSAGLESADALKVMDDQNGEDGDDYENEDAEETSEAEEAEAGAQTQDNQQADRQGRRRRRGRRRPQDGERNTPQASASAESEQQQQPRSALDSLARRQGAIAGS